MSSTAVAATVLRLVLAAPLLAASVAKAADIASTRVAAAALGVPARIARPVAVGLVASEAIVAVMLLIDPLAWAAAIAATALLAVFTVLVVTSLARGRRPPCNCFGSTSTAPIGPGTLVRNGLLLAVAVALVARGASGGRTSLGGLDHLSAAQGWVVAAVITGTALVGLNAWVVVNLLRQQGRLVERIERLESIASGPGVDPASASHRAAHRRARPNAARRGLPIGSMAPRFGGVDVDGRHIGIDDLRGVGRPVVLLFFETHCAACVEMAVDVNRSGAASTDRLLVAVVHGGRDDIAARFAGPGFDVVLVDVDGAIAQRFEVGGTPAAVLVLPDGRIASALAEGRAAASRLVRARIDAVTAPEPMTEVTQP